MEFLRYPHLIRRLFNGGRFGPPWSFTSTSAWTWLGHPVSGLWHTTYRPCQTRSRFGFRPQVLNHAAYHNSPDHSTKGTISHIDVLYVLVSTEFQVLFTPLPGFFSPFLHSTIRYRSLSSIQAWRVVPPSSHGISRAPRYSGSCSLLLLFVYVTLTLSRQPSQTVRLKIRNAKCSPNPERISSLGLASSAFARHYLRNLG